MDAEIAWLRSDVDDIRRDIGELYKQLKLVQNALEIKNDDGTDGRGTGVDPNQSGEGKRT